MEVSSQLYAPAALPPRKEPQVPTDRRLGGHTAGLDAVAKRKIPNSCRESNLDRPASSLIAIPTELSRTIGPPDKYF
jgi:hypothetical protein